MSDYGSVVSRRIPARSASATDQFTVTAALISEADRSVTLARPYHPHVAAGNAFHGYPENHIMQVDAQPSGRTFPASPGRRCEYLYIRRPKRSPGRLVSRLPFRVSRDRIQLADQGDYTSRKLGDPDRGCAVFGGQRGLHAQKLRLRQ